MTTHTSIHQPVKFEACVAGSTAYLSIEDKNGNIISVHMDAERALRIEQAFNAPQCARVMVRGASVEVTA